MGFNKYGNLTKVISNGSYTIVAGAKTIHIKNTGNANGYWTGDITGSDAVSLSAGQSYGFPITDMETFNEVIIDASATTIEISIFY